MEQLSSTGYGPFWTEIGDIWTQIGHIWQVLAISDKSHDKLSRILNVTIFHRIFGTNCAF